MKRTLLILSLLALPFLATACSTSSSDRYGVSGDQRTWTDDKGRVHTNYDNR